MSELNLIPFNDINFTFLSAFTYNNNTTNNIIINGEVSGSTLVLHKFDGSVINISGFTSNLSSGITGLTYNDIITALGYVPLSSATISGNYVTSSFTENNYYKLTNPNNYISSITSNNVIDALGYVPLSSSTFPVDYDNRIMTDIYIDDNVTIFSGDPNSSSGHTELIFQNGINENIFSITSTKNNNYQSIFSFNTYSASTIVLNVVDTGNTVNNRSIDLTTGKPIMVIGNMEYDADYSENYSPRSLVDVNFVTGLTINQLTTSPSATTSPNFTNYYGGNTYALGNPVAWGSLRINNILYKVPLFL